MINYASIDVNNTHYVVHLDNEEELFFVVPMENDGSDNWLRLQEWLDEGNVITDNLGDGCKYYADQRRMEYPDMGEQLDYIYHNGVDAWKSDIIDPIKAKYPKP